MKLFYQRVGNRFLLEKIEKRKADSLTFILSEGACGRLCIGGSTLTLSNGRACVFLSAVPNGALFPRVYTDSGIYPLDPLEKHGDRIAPKELSVEELYAMRLCLEELKGRTDSLEKLTGVLLERVPDNTVL